MYRMSYMENKDNQKPILESERYKHESNTNDERDSKE